MWHRFAAGKGKHLLVAAGLISTTRSEKNHAHDAYNGCKQCRSYATGRSDDQVFDTTCKLVWEHSTGHALETTFEEAGCSVGAVVGEVLCPELVLVGEFAGLAVAGLTAETCNEAIEARVVEPVARRLAAIARDTRCERRVADAACYAFLEGLA